jgi:5,6-dimethylbenzimidazole synthase
MEISNQLTSSPQSDFTIEEQNALYKTIFSRRDVRGQFTDQPVSEDVLSRILTAAHYAPSVGFMQPWNFIIIRSQETKHKIHKLFQTAHQEAAQMFDEKSRKTYKNLKLEGILEAPINICITCDKDRAGPVVIGRTHIKEMDVYSSVCAVQNLWLAARAEGVGLGWVSILDQKKLTNILNIPKNVIPVAYICLGYVSFFHDKPELQSSGWRQRLPLGDIVNFDGYGQDSDDDFAKTLKHQMQKDQNKIEDGAYQAGFIKPA